MSEDLQSRIIFKYHSAELPELRWIRQKREHYHFHHDLIILRCHSPSSLLQIVLLH